MLLPDVANAAELYLFYFLHAYCPYVHGYIYISLWRDLSSVSFANKTHYFLFYTDFKIFYFYFEMCICDDAHIQGNSILRIILEFRQAITDSGDGVSCIGNLQNKISRILLATNNVLELIFFLITFFNIFIS